MQSLGAADPVALHQPDLLRPAIESIERVQEILGKAGNGEIPLRHLALLDLGAGAPAAAVDHLLVGQHRLIDRIPIDFSELALHQPRAEKVEKHPLLVLVIVGLAGRDLTPPIEREPHGFELRPHSGDVLIGPGLGMDLAFDGGIFRGHAERIPSHGMQHVETGRALEPRNHVAHGVIAHVPHVDTPRGVGEHLQDIIFSARVIVAGDEDIPLLPHFLPAGLRRAGVVALDGHGIGMPAKPLRRH